jgi:hypothetical protein
MTRARSLGFLAVAAATATMAAAAGCEPVHEPRQHLEPPATPGLTLLVSNQSFELDPVDITIRLDDQLAVTGDFRVEGQHTWLPFDFDLGEGLHRIDVTTADAEAELHETFTLPGRGWAVVMFWYYPPGSSSEPTPPQFTFSVHDEPPAFH